MKNNRSIILLLIVFSSFTLNSLAQERIKNIQSFYESLNTSNLVKKPIDYNLKGKVKQVIEFSEPKKDSIFLLFNDKGILEKESDSKIHESSTYIFSNNRLDMIYHEDNYSKSQKKFDGFGWIVKEIVDSKDTTVTFRGKPMGIHFHKLANYKYNVGLNELEISYNIYQDTSLYELLQYERYKFLFNTNKQISEEQKKTNVIRTSNIFEPELGANVKYNYYLSSGLLKQIKTTEICLIANSCGVFDVSITYDRRGNKTSQALSDHTIRNSTWSGSYSWQAKYNENNDIMEECYIDDTAQQKYLREIFVNFLGNKNKNKKATTHNILPKLYDYEYDFNGNWIKKYEIINNNKKLIKNRLIEYFS